MTSKSKTLTKKLLDLMGFKGSQIKASKKEETITVQVELKDEEAGILIGHHGEVIDSLQLILNLILNQNTDAWQRILVNVGDYRERREQTIKDLASKAASRAKSTGKEVILSDLPGHERRIIHLLLESDSEVSTYSEGVGRYRHLVVRPQSLQIPEENN